MDDTILSNLTIIVLLVLGNAFFVAAEFSLVRVRRTRIEALVAEGHRGAAVVREAIEHLNDYISATQVGITLASLALGWRGEPFVAHLLEGLVAGFIPAGTATVVAHGIAATIAFSFITFLHVVIGELVPKSVALQYPERVSLYVARPMRFFKVTFRPLISVLDWSSNRFLKLFGVRPAESHALALSEEELLMTLAESKNAGVVTEDEQRMLHNVFKFHDKTVREIMVPRPDIFALKLRADEHEIRAVFEQGYSRLPVYDGTLNNIKGIVYVKDLFYTMQDPKLIKLVDLVREAPFVPETMAVSKLLRDFQKRRMHMAIVVDEFGDTAGLVTLEDVIEEIVGEIQDEYDAEPAQVQRTADGSILFEGRTSLDVFKEVLPQFEMPAGSFETVAGLVFQLANRVPREGEVFHHGGLSFKIARREGRRLRQIVVSHQTARTKPGESARANIVEEGDSAAPPQAGAHLDSAIEIPAASASGAHNPRIEDKK